MAPRPSRIGEFDLIERWFTRPAVRNPLGVGDDCAIVAPGAGLQLAVTSDMLLEGRHFLAGAQPYRLGHKALAVNLSDLAACGARPLAFTLALALPEVEEAFLDGFAQGLLALADRHGIELVGGDTTAGPLTICITAFGEVPAGGALLRSGARAGDTLWVSGRLGDARLALEALRGAIVLDAQALERVRAAMDLPEPRVALGLALRGIATSAIDLSDGLAGDLLHVLRRSGVGATVQADSVPISADLAAQPAAMRRLCTLSGGDDYELLFTAPPHASDAVLRAAGDAAVTVTAIGRIEPASGARFVDGSGAPVAGFAGFDHFAP